MPQSNVSRHSLHTFWISLWRIQRCHGKMSGTSPRGSEHGLFILSLYRSLIFHAYHVGHLGAGLPNGAQRNWRAWKSGVHFWALRVWLSEESKTTPSVSLKTSKCLMCSLQNVDFWHFMEEQRFRYGASAAEMVELIRADASFNMLGVQHDENSSHYVFSSMGYPGHAQSSVALMRNAESRGARPCVLCCTAI